MIVNTIISKAARILNAIEGKNSQAAYELLHQVYEKLHLLAQKFSREKPGQASKRLLRFMERCFPSAEVAQE